MAVLNKDQTKALDKELRSKIKSKGRLNARKKMLFNKKEMHLKNIKKQIEDNDIQIDRVEDDIQSIIKSYRSLTGKKVPKLD